MKRKLKNNRGETVVEVLASILIAALSVALLFGAVMASVNMDLSAQKTDQDLYEGLNTAQIQEGTSSSGTVKISGKNSAGIASSADVSVNFYGSGGVLSYAPPAP